MKRTTQIHGKQLPIQAILSTGKEAAKVFQANCKESGINEEEKNGEFPQNKHWVHFEQGKYSL